MPEHNPLARSRRASSDTALRLEEMKQLLGKLVASHWDVSEMMLVMVQDGLGAMAYGQYGGSTPNPTMNAVISTNPDPDSPMWARNNVPETDLARYDDAIARMHQAAVDADFIRRKYMSANLDMWNRLDPTDFCRIHWFLMHREKELQNVIPRRVVGDLCKDCNEFRMDNGRNPEPLEVDRFMQSGGKHWPHKLVDPKERKAV